jgi:hypothetical protein
MVTQNPYEPPRTAVAEPQHLSQEPAPKVGTIRRSPALLVAYWLMFMASFALPIMAVFVIPVFAEVFQSFGTELSFFTLLVIRYRFALFAWPLIAFVPALMFSLSRVHGIRAYANYKTILVVFLGATVCSIVAMIVAMYLPNFSLGIVV